MANVDDSTSKKVEKIVLIISILITIGALVWIRRKMDAQKEEFVYTRRKARQAKSNSSMSGGTIAF
jgi:ABC-type Fe3+ transport system permease subunit